MAVIILSTAKISYEMSLLMSVTKIFVPTLKSLGLDNCSGNLNVYDWILFIVKC